MSTQLNIKCFNYDARINRHSEHNSSLDLLRLDVIVSNFPYMVKKGNLDFLRPIRN